jgi:predicted anti-sigma-YlaC factor YlaD
MSIVVSSASALGTPISWHIEVAGPDICATLSGGVLVNDVVFGLSCTIDFSALPQVSRSAYPAAVVWHSAGGWRGSYSDYTRPLYAAVEHGSPSKRRRRSLLH